jgi:quinoprotein glucose dehydrogenase
MKTKITLGALAVLTLLLAISIRGFWQDAPHAARRDWAVYGGGPEGIHYSTLDQINRSNVSRLKLAWRFDSGDEFPESEMECSPIVVDGVLYATTPKLRVIALDAASGKLRWSFNPFEGEKITEKVRNRGLTVWGEGSERRIFVPARQYLYALDAATGKPIADFGQGGRVDLREGLGRDPQTLSVSATTPGIVYKDLIIMGSIVSEDLPAAPGDIRAYDVRTGKIRWSFHTIPHPGELGYETWPKDAWKYIGGANNWCGMALDVKRGLVFVPTGSAAFDFYGANRHGDLLFANCLLALRADTGERVWHFQFVKHDVWDRDPPAPPALVTVRRNGVPIDAVAQITKSGFVFVFDRETGKPLFPIEYRKVPPSDVDGEKLATTQPLPLEPPPFARQMLTEDLVTDRTPQAHAEVLARLKKLRNGGQFTPPSREGTVIFPGFDGGGEWGGPAFDPESHVLYINSNEMAWVLRLVERPKPKGRATSRDLYLQHCASCHREDRRGTPPEFPSLLSVGGKKKPAEIAQVISQGRGRMPAFGELGGTFVEALTQYLITGRSIVIRGASRRPSPIDLKYTIDGYNKFLDSEGYPAVKPPWGTLNALDLDTGQYVWRIPFGEWPDLVAKGMPPTGSENYGGAVVTAGGLLFIAATTHDSKFRAFDKVTGKLLWETTLPAAGNATPAAYEVNGRQYVVIGAGGGKWGNHSGGSYLAFALPQ